jgi:molybdate transport system ATP-binding protein
VSLTASIRTQRNGFTLDVQLEVKSGETVAILGPNGSGKTTLLRAIAGLIPMEGRVVVDDRVLEDSTARVSVPAEKRRIGIVFQDHSLFPHLTALENVAFGLRAQGQPNPMPRARQWLARAGLESKADVRPAALSGGQAQRVAILRALATEPRLLLLDEPLSALDVSVRAEVRRDLAQRLADFQGVRLLVTHDAVDAIALADRLVVLESGTVVQAGSPAEVTAQSCARRSHRARGRGDFGGGGGRHR